MDLGRQSIFSTRSKYFRTHLFQVNSISHLPFSSVAQFHHHNLMPHTFYDLIESSFMWQICGSIPQSLLQETDVTCMATQLSVSFFIETFIHAKEKVGSSYATCTYFYVRFMNFCCYYSQQWCYGWSY